MERSYGVKNKMLSGSSLKWIAIVTMFIDHIGAVILEPYLLRGGVDGGTFSRLLQLNTTLRLIGRFAFPIFAFLVVEGFMHTSNLKKYISQLGIFALISEIPFDLAGSGVLLEFTHQNIYFTLFIGLLAIAIFDNFKSLRLMKWLIPIIGMVVGEVLMVDYGAMGVLVIFIFYYFHDDFKLRNLFNGILFLQQMTAVLALIPIQLYNGKRGKQNKYFFYLFYPAHLLLLFFIREYLVFL